MKAVIVHEARIVDPTAIGGYMAAAARYRWANSAGIQGYDSSYQFSSGSFTDYYGPNLIIGRKPTQLFLPEGPNPQNPLAYRDMIRVEQFKRIRSGAELGDLVYPVAFGLLRKLDIRGVRHLKDLSTKQAPRVPVYTLHGLREFIGMVPYLPISFDARINLPRGMYRSKIRINPFIAVYAATNENAPNYNSQNLRAIDITARFTNPESAVLGLRGLAAVFPDFVFEEKLLVGNLPGHIAEMYKKIEGLVDEYLVYEYGLTSKKPDLDWTRYREMTSQLGMAHIEFLKPMFEGLDIHPHRADYYDDRSNIPYQIPVESLDDVIGLISRGYYNSSRIPTIHATFNGQEIAIEFPSWESRLGSNFAMQVRNGSNNHTLEFILEGIKSRFPAK